MFFSREFLSNIHHVDTNHSTVVMVTFHVTEGDSGWKFFFFFPKYLYHAVVHNFENYRSSHNCSTKFQLWGGFPSTLSFSQPFNRAILVSVYVFLLLNRLLHAQKVIIFMVAYSKVGDILWKWKQNFKHLFIFIFIITFYISQQQWTLQKLKPSN